MRAGLIAQCTTAPASSPDVVAATARACAQRPSTPIASISLADLCYDLRAPLVEPNVIEQNNTRIAVIYSIGLHRGAAKVSPNVVCYFLSNRLEF